MALPTGGGGGLRRSAGGYGRTIALVAVVSVVLIIGGATLLLGGGGRNSSTNTSIDSNGYLEPARTKATRYIRPIAKSKEDEVFDTPRGKTAAIAVLFTNAKPGADLSPVVDAAAVTCRVIMTKYKPKVHTYEPICVAMLTDDVNEQWEKVIKWLGFRIMRVKIPLEASEIRNPQIAQEVVKDGAMGIAEMAKVEGFRMVEYDRVVMIDGDVFFHQPVEVALRDFDQSAVNLTTAALGWTKGGWESERMNGGFLIFNPRADGAKHFRNIVDILKEGDFRSGTGWRGSGIGWTYGGRTIQGLLPYYFLHYLPKDAKVPNTHIEMQRCRYNNMVQLEPCKQTNISDVVSNHFTGDCLKPWWCSKEKHPLCTAFGKRWWTAWEDLREESIVRMGAGSEPAEAMSRLVSRCTGGFTTITTMLLIVLKHVTPPPTVVE